MRVWLSRSLAMLLLVPCLGTVALDQASAGQCRLERTLVQAGDRTVSYKVTKMDCAAGQTPGVRPVVVRGAAPSCDIKSASPATFCWGANPCYYKDSVVPYLPPATPPPTPGADWKVRMCFISGQPGGAPTGTALWVGQAPQPPSQIDQAREATGRIRMPSATLSFNPTARTLVNLDTWFWAHGLSGDELRGTGAFGLVAVATPARLEVDPGDGSAMPPCVWVTAKSDRCKYAYWRSSIGGPARGQNGGAAYQASARAYWTVRFELNGAPVIIPGAPSELRGPEMSSPVVVVEVQTIVTETG